MELHPSRLEQVAIAEFVDRNVLMMANLSSDAHRGIELLQERRTALISAAVTGKIDVRGFGQREDS
jgi:type I restriction enzyme, S subunit